MPSKISKRTGKREDAPVDYNRALQKRRARRMTSRRLLERTGRDLNLEDLSQGLDVFIQIVTTAKESRWTWRLRRWADKFVRAVAKAGGPSEMMAFAKSFLTSCRQNAIGSLGGFREFPTGEPGLPPFRSDMSTMDKRQFLHQLSRVARSLREADMSKVLESLDEHKALCQTPFKTPDEIMARWKRYLRFRFGGSTSSSPTGVGASSSFLFTKAKGGAASEIQDITNSFREKMISAVELSELASRLPSFLHQLAGTKVLINWEAVRCRLVVHGSRNSGLLPKFPTEIAVFPYDKESEMSLEDWEARREVLFSVLACWEAVNLSELPRCRQVAVKERGWKVRVATPLEAANRYLLSMINGALLSGLESVPQVVSALHGCPAEKLDWSVGRKRHKVFSADLKTATDRLPHDLMLAAIDVLGESWPDELLVLSRRAVGPHIMTCHDGEDIVTSRGILMGSPISWPLLSMYSAFLHAESGSDGWYAVCGDDYIGCHDDASYRRYKSIREATGALGSPGKDLMTKTSVGVFAEELVSVGRCRCVPTASVRAVLGDPKSGQPAWSQGPEVSQALSRLVLTGGEKHRIVRAVHSNSVNKLLRCGIDPFGPRWIGGAGFPGIPSQRTLVRARVLVSQSVKQVTTWVANFNAAWATSGTSSLLCDAVAEDLAYHADFEIESDRDGEWGPLKDVVSLRMASLSWPYLLAGVERPLPRVVLSITAGRIRSVSEEISRKGYWLDPAEKIVRGDGIVSRLQKLEPMTRPIPFRPILSKIQFAGPAYDSFKVSKARSGPGSPGWGPPRNKARLYC